MNIQEFVQHLRSAVCKSAGDDVVGVLEVLPQPPPSPMLRELSVWFCSLDEKQQRNVATIVGMTADQTMYKFMQLLDGEIKLRQDKERLFLAYACGNEDFIVNPVEGQPVHRAWLGEV